ncbi:MAG: hypothetical protein K2M87_03955, partial [Muribaculaceae bacterium]|nr:hypothetical protein [Muribaculaceae bacterium]
PEGYFDSLSDQIMAKLPEYPAKPVVKEMTTWQRLKPYVYLAAMFAGIWCMMQIFHHAGGLGRLNLDNPPEQIAAYIDTVSDDDMLILPASESDDELIEDVSEQYDNIADFEKDFGYKLKPQYAGMIVD